MNLSPRWCVTAVVALGALSCSDPVPPAAQGAFIVTLSSGVPNRACPSGAASTFDVPAVVATNPLEKLDDDTYLHWTIDGEGESHVSCSVSGSSSFTFSGRVQGDIPVLEISQGTLSNNMTGTARIGVSNGSKLSTSLGSTAADCTITVVSNSKGPQVKPGSIWANFSCPALIHDPGDGCSAKGTFVLENCTQ
jgi:hypothetical protein